MAGNKWITLANAICDDASIRAGEIEIITTWEQTFPHNDNLFRNNAVFRIGEGHILKVFGTDAERTHAVERASLQTLMNQFPAPRYIVDGNLDGRPYLIMSEIDGETLQTMWDDLSAGELLSIARQIGTQTADLHNCSPDKLAEVETRLGRGEHEISNMEAERVAEIKAMENLSTRHKDDLFRFMQDEAPKFLNVPPVFNHADMSHAHVYVMRKNEKPIVTGWIDWAGAMIASPECDLTFHWFWTFSQHHATMRECLNAYYEHFPEPEQFARRCFVAHFYTFSMEDVWDYFTETLKPSDSIVDKLIRVLYPPDIFGVSD